MEMVTRFLTQEDAPRVFELYRAIAGEPGGFARTADEISLDSVEQTLRHATRTGISIGAVEKESGQLVGSIIARKLGPQVFDHVLSDLTIGVHPSFQRQGVGRRLFIDFLEHIQGARPDVLRVELIARETNHHAIRFYESIGFRSEGVFEKRIRNAAGDFESDIPMAWIKR
jgi:ribosomal protein S18 acetylase RimI-like enzyme